MMRSASRKIFLAIVAITIVTAALLLVRTFRTSAPSAQNQEPASDARIQKPSPPERPGVAGKAVTNDGMPASFTSFSSNGNWFRQWSEYHDSPRSAARAFESALKHATQVIRREPLLDDSGHQVGEKAVATFSGKYAYYGDASLLWTNGSDFRYVAGSSLQSILDYDKGSP